MSLLLFSFRFFVFSLSIKIKRSGWVTLRYCQSCCDVMAMILLPGSIQLILLPPLLGGQWYAESVPCKLKGSDSLCRSGGVGCPGLIYVRLGDGLFIPLLPPFLPPSFCPPPPPILYPICFFLSTVGLWCRETRFTRTHTHTHAKIDWWYPLLHAYAMALFIIIYHFTVPTPFTFHMGIIILWCGCRVYSTEDRGCMLCLSSSP